MREKPDCTGQRFGRLTVLGKGDRKPDRHTFMQLWKLQCDCGNVIQMRRQSFDSKHDRESSCGCAKRDRVLSMNRAKEKPDCTGQLFGQLTVLGKAEGQFKIAGNGQRNQLWSLQCSCGSVIQKPRGDFENANQVSCGCARRRGLVDNRRQPKNIIGKRFGSLLVMQRSDRKSNGKWLWIMQCDCGATCDRTHALMKQYQQHNYQINCGNKAEHPANGLWYPPTPSPYPEAAGELLTKYLYLCRTKLVKNAPEIEDTKRDRLIRACWILTYRKQEGEEFSEQQERNFIAKHLAYCSVDVFWQQKVFQYGGLLYTATDTKKQIGSAMTDITLQSYPVCESETRGTITLSTRSNPHRLRFSRR